MKLDTMSGESLKLGAVGSRPVREYHLYGVLEDNASGVHLGGYLAQNSSWQMELTGVSESVSLSIGLADSITGLWSRKIAPGESFCSPVAYVSTVHGGIAELSNRLPIIRKLIIKEFTFLKMPDFVINVRGMPDRQHSENNTSGFYSYFTIKAFTIPTARSRDYNYLLFETFLI